MLQWSRITAILYLYMKKLQSIIRRLKYPGWTVFLLSFCNLIVEGGAKNAESVFYLALKNGFKTGATVTSLVFSLGGLFGAIASPLLGRLLDKLGPKRFFVLAGIIIFVGWQLSSYAPNLWYLYIFYSFIAAVGHTSVSSFTAMATLSPWFPTSRGTVLGLADAGNPFGQAIFTPLSQALVLGFGWRWSFRILGTIFFLLVVPLNLLLQKPLLKNENLHLSEMADSTPRKQSNSFKAYKIQSVWWMIGARGFLSISNQMIRLHILAFFVLSGYDQMNAATAVGLIGALSVLGRPSLGYLSDKVGRESMFTFGITLQIIALSVLIMTNNMNNLFPILLYVAFSGLTDGIGGLILSAKAGDIYPREYLGEILGLVEIGRGIGIAVGPILGGILFDLKGDYLLAFTIAMVLSVLSIFCSWMIRVFENPKIKSFP